MGAIASPAPPPAPDDLVVLVGGRALKGWTSARVTRRIEACPNDFEVAFTELYPGEADAFIAQPGEACVVRLGADAVLTGYVDSFARGYDSGRHTLTLAGRGKCCDLVDCSAEWPTGQITGANALQIAQKLAGPYGVTASCLSDPGPQIPQFNLTLGETAYDIIERICRYAGLLAYEGTDGNLVLANTLATTAASGFSEGVNVLSAQVVASLAQRFSVYECALLAMNVFEDAGQGGNLYGQATDPNVPRHRLTYLIAEAGGGGQDVCLRRARWEAARRIGRGTNVRVITDAWRDSAGALYAPNTKAPLSLPALHVDKVTWTIGEVTYRRDETGTTAELTLMDPSAYQPEPILLQPQFLDVRGVGS